MYGGAAKTGRNQGRVSVRNARHLPASRGARPAHGAAGGPRRPPDPTHVDVRPSLAAHGTMQGVLQAPVVLHLVRDVDAQQQLGRQGPRARAERLSGARREGETGSGRERSARRRAGGVERRRGDRPVSRTMRPTSPCPWRRCPSSVRRCLRPRPPGPRPRPRRRPRRRLPQEQVGRP